MKKFMFLTILLMILTLLMASAYSTGDLDNMSLEDLQKLQEQLNQKIIEKQQTDQTDEIDSFLPDIPLPEPTPEPILIKGIKITPPKEPMASGKSNDLKTMVTLSPKEASKKGLEFSVNDEELAEITADERLLAKKAGTVTLTVTDPISGKKASARIKIITLVDNIEITPSTQELFIGKTLKLEATVYPDDATNKRIKWESQNPEIATISSNGTVKAIAPGRATIYCLPQDGSFIKGVALISVLKPVEKITFSSSNYGLIVGESSYAYCTVEPEDATIQYLHWESSDPKRVEVRTAGEIIAKAVGSSTITATAMDDSGVTAQCTVYAEPKVPMHIDMLTFETDNGERTGRIYLEATNDCGCLGIKGFTVEIRCYDREGDIPTITTLYMPGLMGAGQWGTTPYTDSAVEGMKTASIVHLILTEVQFTNGTTYSIPKDLRKIDKYNLN